MASDGTTGVVTAAHTVAGNPPTTAWSLIDASGNIGQGYATAVSTAVDTAFLKGSTQWASSPLVKLSDDFRARFAAVAKSSADVLPGDRVCRTGWAPMDGTGVPTDGSPNFSAPNDILPSGGASVVCGRVISATSSTFVVGRSDRPDKAIVSRGGSGGAVWKNTSDRAFMFLGIVSAALGNQTGTIGGLPAYSMLQAIPAWTIGSDVTLKVRPMLNPDGAPFFVLAASTTHPMQGAGTTLGSLCDADGNPIAGKQVDILGGPWLAMIGTTVTGQNGEFQFPVPSVGETQSFAVRWAGDSTHAASASRVIRISPTIVTIASPPSSVPAGSALTITARATGAAGSPVVGRQVSLQVYPNGGTTFSIVATGTTDGAGQVSLTGPAVTAREGYAARLSGDDQASNGDPFGAAASAIYTVSPA